MADEINVLHTLYFNFESKECSNVEELTQKKLVECISIASRLSKDYLWQNQSFNLVHNQHQNQVKGYSSITGETNCGESINDEWFVVYILLQISVLHPDVVISIEDDDGQFLLIEAADYLPNWLKPDTSENRVFIHKGEIHVIPLPSKPSDIIILPTGTPSIEQALKLIFAPFETRASDQIQAAIQARTNKFKDSFDDLFHHCHCYLPSSLVYILNQRPEFISLAVQNIHNDQSNNRQIEKFVQCFNKEKRFLARVRFTKLMYSQLLHKKLEPATTSKWKYDGKNGISKKANDMGYKLAAGFGIFYEKSRKINKKEDKLIDPKWQQFLDSLKKFGFFKDEMEGSNQWRILQEKAKDFFINSTLDLNEKEEIQSANFISLLDEGKTQDEPKEDNILPEDDDSWLDMTQAQLDQLLENHFATRNENKSSQRSASSNLEQVVNKLKNFIGKESDFEGVEISENESINFNPSSIEEKLRKFINNDDEDGGDSEDDFLDDDYDDDGDLDDKNNVTLDSCQDEQMHHVMAAMEEQLRNTTIGSSFETMPTHKHEKTNESRNDNQDDDESLNIDFNLVKNFLQSVSSQEGFSGPVSNILTSLGMSIPPDSTD